MLEYFQGKVPSHQSCFQAGELYSSQASGRCVHSHCRNPPPTPLLHQGKHVGIPTGLPGPEWAAVGMVQLITSGSSDVDYATVHKGLEMSGNHRLALMAGPFYLLPDCRLL